MILRLGFAELGVTDLPAARAFYVDVLGFREHASTPSALFLRAAEEFDAWSLKLTQTERPGLLSFAFRVSDESDLDRLLELHDRKGLPAQLAIAGAEPGIGRQLRVVTPDGFAIAFYHQSDEVAWQRDGRIRLPMRYPGGGIPPARLDHINLRTTTFAVAQPYWLDSLGFSISEAVLDPAGAMEIAWLRRGPGSHDLGMRAGGRSAFHHLAYAVADAHTLVRIADVLADAGMPGAIQFGPGRHGVSNAFFIYVVDPAGNRLEFFVGDYLRDQDRPPVLWSHEEYFAQGILWWGAQPPEAFFVPGELLAPEWRAELEPLRT